MLHQELGPGQFAEVEREEDRLEVEYRLADLRAAEPVAVAVDVIEEEDTSRGFWSTSSFSSGDED